jgi:ABC-type amino acid transport substrate-binding protein
MHTILKLITIILVSTLTAYGISAHYDKQGPATSQNALTRVGQTQTLRCGYVDYEPANYHDPKTGKLKGILVEVAEAMGKRLGFKIEWVLAGGWSSFISDMQAGKFDAFCGAAWGLMPPELLTTTTSAPIYYSTISAWVEVDNTAIKDDLSNVDSPSVTIAATDGSFPMILAQSRYPKAKILSLPETAAYSLNLTNVADSKADIGFVEQYIASQYNIANPGRIKRVGTPVYVAANMFSTLKRDADLLDAIEMALVPLYLNGEIERRLSRSTSHNRVRSYVVHKHFNPCPSDRQLHHCTGRWL